jgi:8-oxo-dGTP pyrophosphatase MutT (NUDIX family)
MAYVPKACGFVLVREGPKGLQYLLLTSRKHGGMGVPKGHVDPGESELQTALRETREETGLSDLRPDPWFRAEMHYSAERKGRTWDKQVVLFVARTGHEQVRLSQEHTTWSWLPLADALVTIAFPNLRRVVRDAALFLKDRALFDLEPVNEALAGRHLEVLPEASEDLMEHLEGGARLARTFALALNEAGCPLHVEATATGARLHDVGRALGRHEDHQIAGLRHLRDTPLAAYGFACISHFTKGALPGEMLGAGIDEGTVDVFRRAIDTATLTWEEHCVALADACMKGSECVPPAVRFDDLRSRYENRAIIDLQERRTVAIRRTMEATLGHDPLTLVGLA